MSRNQLTCCFLGLGVLFAMSPFASAEDSWVVYEGNKGPGQGKHIVFVTGDDEYRSEEGMPMLAKILSVRHGFKCTVLFAVDPKTGVIKPDHQTNIPGLEALDSADLMVLFLRFRELPDKQMKHIVDFTHSGKPIIGLRTATHAFNYSRNKNSKFRPLTFNSGKPRGGWGGLVLGDTWLNPRSREHPRCHQSQAQVASRSDRCHRHLGPNRRLRCPHLAQGRPGHRAWTGSGRHETVSKTCYGAKE